MRLAPLIRLLTLLALILAPAGMMRDHVAAAAPVPADQTGHHAVAGQCADMGDGGEERSGPTAVDCTIACSALPAAAGALPERIAAAPALHAPAPAAAPPGLHPEADPPPPRAA